MEYVSELKKFYTSNACANTIGVVDVRQMKMVKKLPTEGKPDRSAYAAPFHKLYVSDERGKAEAIVDVDPEHYRKLEDFKVQHAVHSLAVDPETHRVYTPKQEENGKPVARMVVYEAVTGQ